MKLYEVWIEGTSSLLQHRFLDASTEDNGALDGGGVKRAHRKQTVPRDEAEAHCYRDTKDKALYMPSASIARMLREAGSGMKQKSSRKSMKYVIPSSVLLMGDTIPLFARDKRTRIKTFEVDSRPVVIPATRGRIMRHRPRIDEWMARFTIRINEDLIDSAVVRQLLVEGGQQLGIGDYRPEKGGPFGMFGLVSWTPSETIKIKK